MNGWISSKIDVFDSQVIRRVVQLFFLGAVILIGIEFYRFAAQLESGRIPDLERPPGVEAFLPISALVSLKYLFLTGKINEIHPSGLVFFLLVCLSALLLKKSFCGWVCPFGLLSEYLSKINSAIFAKPIKVPGFIDSILRSIKYLIAAFFVWTIFVKMPGAAVEQFVYSAYNIISDVKMLKFFTDISMTAFIAISVILLLSVIVKNFWCRYLCPYGAVLGFISLFSAAKIRRNAASCTKCGKCDRACPSLIKISDKKTVVADECNACMKCAGVCPEENTLDLSFFSKAFPVKPAIAALILFAVYAGGITLAHVSGHWQNQVSKKQYLMYMMSEKMIDKDVVVPAMRDLRRREKMMEMMNNSKN